MKAMKEGLTMILVESNRLHTLITVCSSLTLNTRPHPSHSIMSDDQNNNDHHRDEHDREDAQNGGASNSNSSSNNNGAENVDRRDDNNGGASSLSSSRRDEEGGSGSSTGGISLHVRHIASSATNASIEKYFGVVGPVKEVRVPKDRTTGGNSGFAFVDFETPDDAAKAIKLLHHTTMDGQQIDVVYSRNKYAGRRDGRDGGDHPRRGGDRYGGDPYRGGAPFMGYPNPYAMAYPSGGGRGGGGAAAAFPPSPYGYGMPYGMPYMGGASAPRGATGSSSSRDTATAFPAYGMPGAGAYPYMDPRLYAMYAQAAAGMPGMAAKKDLPPSSSSKSRRSRTRSRTRSRSRSRR